MRRLLLATALLLLCPFHGRAQNTVVNATVVDPNTVPYQAGTGHFNIKCTGNSQPYYNGSPLPRTIIIPALSGTGFFQIQLWDTSIATDTNSAPLTCQWQAQIMDHCQVATFSVLVTGVTGAGPVNLSSQINAAAVPVSAACTPGQSVIDLTASLPIVVTPNPITNTGVISCPTCATPTVPGVTGQVLFNVGGNIGVSTSVFAGTTAFMDSSGDFLLEVPGSSYLQFTAAGSGAINFNATNGNIHFGTGTGQLTLLSANLNTEGAHSEILAVGTASLYNGALLLESAGGGGGELLAPATGSPNPIVLPVATGTSGQVLTTDGGNPQNSSWANPVKRMILPFASCNSTTAAPAWDLPTSNPAVATCKTGGTNLTVQGVLAYADGDIAYYSGIVPSDWQSWGLSRISFTTSDTTNGHTIIFKLALACDTPNGGNTDDPAYGTANAYATVTIGGGATANASYQTSTSPLSGGSCAAGSLLHFELTRATDTSSDTAIAVTGWLEVLYNGTVK